MVMDFAMGMAADRVGPPPEHGGAVRAAIAAADAGHVAVPDRVPDTRVRLHLK